MPQQTSDLLESRLCLPFCHTSPSQYVHPWTHMRLCAGPQRSHHKLTHHCAGVLLFPPGGLPLCPAVPGRVLFVLQCPASLSCPVLREALPNPLITIEVTMPSSTIPLLYFLTLACIEALHFKVNKDSPINPHSLKHCSTHIRY